MISNKHQFIKRPNIIHKRRLPAAKLMKPSSSAEPPPANDKVFEFETTISVSLDTNGYMMTIILISQIIIFGMVLYSRSVNE